MKHFEDPLTTLLINEQLGSSRSTNPTDPSLLPFLDSVFSRVHNSSLIPEVDHASRWLDESPDNLLGSVRAARELLRKQVKLLRVAFQLLLLVQRFMVPLGHKPDKTLPELMSGAIRGRLGTTHKFLCAMVKYVTDVFHLLPLTVVYH